MESLASERRVAPIGLDRFRHLANRVRCRLGSRRNVGRGVMMIVAHDVAIFVNLS